MARTLPTGLVPGLGGALWPVTFLILQVITNIYFYRAGFWRILREGIPNAEDAVTSVTFKTSDPAGPQDG
jgi:hypothetical protein